MLNETDIIEMTTMTSGGDSTSYIPERVYVGALIDHYPLIAVPYAFITVVALILGTVGNVLLLVTLGIHRKLQKVGREFIQNLAVADLCVAAVADPLCLIAVFKGEKWFLERPVLCEMIASLCLTACFCAFLSLSCITVSRMCYICHNELYHNVFTKKKTILICIVCWVVGFMFEVGNFLGWGDHTYDQKNHSCIWDRTASKSYTYFVGVFLICGSLTMMFLSNLKIFLAIRNTKTELHKVTRQDKNDEGSDKIWRETIKACKTLFIIFGVFLFCWIPYTVIILMDIDNTVVPMPVHLYGTLLAHFHSSVNFIVYIGSNRQFRDAFMKSFCPAGCHDGKLKGSGVSSTSVTTSIATTQAAPAAKKKLG